MLVIPPVSDRGVTRPRVEASAVHPNASKKKWFAVYTAASPRKVRPGAVDSQSKSNPSCLSTPTYDGGKTGFDGRFSIPLFPGYVFVCVDANERLPVVQTAGVVYIVGNGTCTVAC